MLVRCLSALTGYRFPDAAYARAWLRGQAGFLLSRGLSRIGLGGLMAPRARFDFEHRAPDGRLLASWAAFNLVTTVGKTDIVAAEAGHYAVRATCTGPTSAASETAFEVLPGAFA
jgi:hypothetical protein